MRAPQEGSSPAGRIPRSVPTVAEPAYPEADSRAPVGKPKRVDDWREALAPYLNVSASRETGPERQIVLKPPGRQYGGDAVRVGLLLPLSGPHGVVGRSMRDAALLALFDFGDDRFELLPHDTRAQSDEAIYTAGLAVGDGARLIVGPLLAPSVEAVAPLARGADVPVVGFSSDHSVAGNGVYTTGFLPGAEVRRIATYAMGRGLSRFAVLAPDDSYGMAVLDELQDTIAHHGGTLTDVALYDPAGGNLETIVRVLADYDARHAALIRLREELAGRDDELSKKTLERLRLLQTLGDLPYDALLIADGGARLQQVAALLPFYDIDPRKVRMIGTGQWDDEGVGIEPALLGGWYAAPDPEKRRKFMKRFKSVFGYMPPRLATLAYDATALAAVLARNDAAAPYTVENLTLQSGYAGRDGIFRLTPEGITERGLAILQVHRQGARVIDRAPVAFALPTN